MMEEGDETLGFEREICWMSEQAEMWLDSVDRTIAEPVHVDRVARTIAALQDIERRAGTQCCAVAASRAAKIKTDLGALIPFGLDVNSPVAFDRDLARLRLEISRLIAAVGFVDEAIVAVAKARGFTLRLNQAPDNGSGVSLASGVFARDGIERTAPAHCIVTNPRLAGYGAAS
jgi:hypothetical protein